ncbi:GGDEF domain-containing protein [Emcibacter sp. SYSU 3D8]|uniref:GGDEF domain-containing protein n=1 Tax=Emcibacter sp. SYSU 3D8 TaxID=3133969 RepID=UPI0031FE9F85
MEFQALTGSVAFAVTQTAVALFMAGLYVAARRDACTRYWAIASALIAIGVIAPFPFIGTSFRLTSMAVGTTAIVAGLVWMWWGMRVFFGRAPKRIGWWLIAGHAVIFSAVFALTSETQLRVITFAVGVAVAVTLIVIEVWRGSGEPLTVARRLVVFAFIITLAPIVARAAILLGTGVRMTPLTDTTFNVLMLYLLPMAGGLLSSVGTLLMYFERTIDEKDHLANHDELTRLYNRRAFTVLGEQALAAAIRQDKPISMLLIDIDHFKAVNDTLGHEAGDRALFAIAAALSETCRRSDIVGRHGGEEFCVICPDTSAEEAMRLGERLLLAVEALTPPAGFPRGFSISIGIATASGEQAWDALLLEADRALYIAKDTGRNRAVAA